MRAYDQLTVIHVLALQTIRGFLKGGPPSLAVHDGWCLANAEARLGPRATWYGDAHVLVCVFLHGCNVPIPSICSLSVQ